MFSSLFQIFLLVAPTSVFECDVDVGGQGTLVKLFYLSQESPIETLRWFRTQKEEMEKG